MDNHNSHYPDIGTQGESFVAQWLQQQGWQILAQRWRCRWGELDLIAYGTGHLDSSNPVKSKAPALQYGGNSEPTLAFIEVKTRSSGNWDADGRLAITPQKQMKVGRAAQAYLSANPQWADYPCRFDVAIVKCISKADSTGSVAHQFQLQDYLINAWDLV